MNCTDLLAALDPKTMLIVGVLMIGLVLIRLLLRPKKGPRPYASPLRTRDGTPSHSLDAPPEINRWEVQMQETARNLMGELNTRIVVLEQLIRDANAAAERLERANASANRPPEN